MKRLVPLVSLTLALSSQIWAQGLPVAVPEEVGLSAARLQRLDALLQEAVDREQIPGVVMLVARHGQVAYYNVHGSMDLETEQPMRVDALFRIAAMSKPLTSVAAMLLYEEGRFLLNDPISLYLPEYSRMEVADPQGGPRQAARRPITVRHLLNHTSGLTYGEGPLAALYEEAGISVGLGPAAGTVGDMVSRLARLPLISHPGEEFHNGLSTDVLGRLIEVVADTELDEFLQTRVFDPLEMPDTHFQVPRDKLPRVAITYITDGQGKLTREPVDPAYLLDQEYFSGGNGLVSTAADYLRFCQMILNGGELDGVRLLSRKTVELMTTSSIGELFAPFRAGSGDKFGYGFGIRTERGPYDEVESLGTLGWDGALYTRFWIDPEEELIGVFMAQSRGSWRTDLLGKARVLVYQAIVD